MEHQTGINVETFSAPAPSAGPQFVRNPPVRLFRHPERISFRNRRDPDIPTATFLDRISHIGRRRAHRVIGSSKSRQEINHFLQPSHQLQPAAQTYANDLHHPHAAPIAIGRRLSSLVRRVTLSPPQCAHRSLIRFWKRNARAPHWIRGAGYVGRASPRSPSIGSRK